MTDLPTTLAIWVLATFACCVMALVCHFDGRRWTAVLAAGFGFFGGIGVIYIVGMAAMQVFTAYL